MSMVVRANERWVVASERVGGIALPVALLALAVILAVLEPAFLSTANLIGILRQVALVGIMAAAMTFVKIRQCATKPGSGGMPASDSMPRPIISAAYGLRANSPFSASIRSCCASFSPTGSDANARRFISAYAIT